jgi:hypothetical protein
VGFDIKDSDIGDNIDEISQRELVLDVELGIFVGFDGENLVCHCEFF